MFKPAAPRLLSYSIHAIRAVRPRRTLFSSAPPSQRSRSWKSLAVRLGIAAGGVYYYSTSNAFAEEPAGIYLTRYQTGYQTLQLNHRGRVQ